MSTTPRNKISEAAALTLKFIDDIKALLDTPEESAIFLPMNADATRMLNRLNGLSGAAPQHEKTVMFPPVTSFMGEAMDLPKKIVKEDLSAKEFEKQSYVQRVEKLETELPTLADEAILNGYTIPEDVLVLRGVAKRAGVPDYETADINQKFIDAIRAGIKSKEDDAENQRKLDEEIRKNAGQGSGTTPMHEMTAEDFAAYPHLTDLGYVPGDNVAIPEGAPADFLKEFTTKK